ncbi:MAG: flagellar hook-length control protein FliK [Carboxydocellales bacterium]
MNVRINQNNWEVSLPKVENNQELKNKQAAVGFGRALANSLKSANKTGYQHKPTGSRLNGPREIKAVGNETIVVNQPITQPTTLHNSPKEQPSKTEGDGTVEATPAETCVEKPQELSVATDCEETKQAANLEQQSWWLEFMGLLNMLAKLGGLEEAELEANYSSVSGPAGQIIPASESVEQEVLVSQLTGQEQAVLKSLQHLTTDKDGAFSEQITSFPGMNNLAMLSLVTAGFNQTEGNTDTQMIQSKVLVKDQGELLKLAASLKPILEQLLQGKVTIAAAAETILNNNGLMEQIALQVKLLKLQLTTNKQSVDVETTIPDQPQEGVVQQKTTGNVTPEYPEKAIKVTTSSEVPIKQVGKQNQEVKPLLNQAASDEQVTKTEDAPEDGTESENFQGGTERSKEFVAVRTLPGAEPIFKELPEQLWALQPTPQQDGTALELAEATKTQLPRMAREIVNQMVFQQIVNNSHMLIGKDHSEIKIQLKPEFLGKVSLEISIEKGVVKAEIVAENQQVKQLIEANLGNLRQTLTNQGLKVSQLVVNLGGQSQFGQTKEQSQNTGRGTRKQPNTEAIFELGAITGEYGLDLSEANQVVDYKV